MRLRFATLGLIFLLISAALAPAAHAAAFSNRCAAPSVAAKDDAIDRMVLREMAAQHAPGVAMVIVEKGRASKIRGYGYADLESCVPATDHTLFGLGSVTKQFTAVAALTLVRDHVISLDDEITKFLPEGTGVWDGINVRHLLTHTSGIPDYCGDDPKFPSIALDRASSPSTEDLLRQIAKSPLNFRPGDDWAYSNTGYLVLSALIERVSKQPFPAYMHDRVFAPLGMAETRFYSPTELIPGRATPYHNDETGQITHGPFISDQFSRWGDMGMLSTARDMARWVAAAGRDELLPANLWREMVMPVRLNDGVRFPYGFGIFIDQVGDEPLWFHPGSFRVGYTAMLFRFPKRDTAVVTLVNTSGYASPADDVALEAIGAQAPELAPSSMREAKSDPQPRLTASLIELLKGSDRAHGAAAMAPAFARHDDSHKLVAAAFSEGHSQPALRFVGCRSAKGAPPAAFGTPVERQCAYRVGGAPGLPPGVVFWLTRRDEVAGLSFW